MASPPQPILDIAEFIADPVAAADFPQTILRFRNDRAAADVGLDGISDDEWVRHFGRFEPLPGNLPRPLALRYHGHQFRVYNPEIGDGRGFLFAQLKDKSGRWLDLGTKGSGQTPYSRFGDGRLTLKGGVREILATEMLQALGVSTSRSFSLIETGEQLHRGDEPSPTRAAVLVRLSHGHIRIGSFQRLAFLKSDDELRRLTDYSLRTYFGSASADPIELLRHVVEGTARLAASYMAAGFVHGVLNSDNINITAESFDYGPWRFAPTFDPGFTAAYFDHAGLYSYGRQAEAIQWDVVQLAGSLRTIAEVDAMIAELDRFPALYRAALIERFLWRLGVGSRGLEEDVALVQAIEEGLVGSRVGIDRFFFDWASGDLRHGSDVYADEAFAPFRERVAAYAPARSMDHPFWSGEPCSMHIEEVEAIWARIAEDDDWSALHAKVAQVRAMGEALGV
ncbi:YdiU family protein [Sphingomonas sp. MAH-20]|uniref:YdiU family protein n=1 Tax=Sphingomonas horti TaxID=2682842 RepID=A0A6I4IZ44_9SPHN|nr:MULTISPECIES: YdiU family protein [Sphingomonas]MBA2918379.1 YdiU family protein [Sphingomonas sp. CGMCC 1.13658]MVO77346.1 YdiU family protein [Sphingomonas horti]